VKVSLLVPDIIIASCTGTPPAWPCAPWPLLASVLCACVALLTVHLVCCHHYIIGRAMTGQILTPAWP
jgi:hypothetical protein